MAMHAPTALAISLLAASGAAARDLPAELRSKASPMAAAVLAATADGALDEGRALLAAANPVQAIAAFRTALASDPRSVAALNGLAVAYDRLGRADLARQYFEQALALEPDAADIAYNLGWTLLKAGQYRDAIAPLQRAAAGPDGRIGNAARRALAIIAARLDASALPSVAVAAANAAPAGPRIDVVASGEAVLVLAAAPPLSARSPAAPSPTHGSTPGPAAQPAAPAAPTVAVLAANLGDAASLTIPASTAAAPQTVAAAPPPPLRAAAPPPVHHRAAPPVPPPSAPPPASPRAVVAAIGPNRAIAAPAPVPAHAMHQVQATAGLVPSIAASQRLRPDEPGMPQPADPKAEIRLAIARLEWLLERLEARHA
jgi:hypothetical protein